MTRLGGLGRGFDSLIPTELVEEEFDLTLPEEKAVSKLTQIRLEEIERDKDQPRKGFDEEALEALADSIRVHGVLQPIVVTYEDGKYKIVAGERRWRAARLAGLEKIPAIVRSLDAQNRLELSIIENAQREDLNAIELATAYAKLKAQFNLSVKQIAERVGRSEAAVTNTMRLLNLPEQAKRAMYEHNLTEGVMRPLVKAEPKLIEKALEKIIEEEWTARMVEKFMAEHKKPSSTKALKAGVFQKQEGILEKKYGARVKIRGRSVTFGCKNEEELKKLLEKLA